MTADKNGVLVMFRESDNFNYMFLHKKSFFSGLKTTVISKKKNFK